MQKFLFFIVIILCSIGHLNAQIKEDVNEFFVNDSIPSIVEEYDKVSEEITAENPKFSPDPIKAIWYSALFPGGGQLYNRKYWKIPIIYGGYMGLTYAVTWNQRYYKGYATAYRDLVENSPNKSYLDYVRPGFDVDANREWLENALKRRKDSYRRYRDLSIICMAAVYLITMIDAYVDASLYHFDISPDISMQVTPALMEKNSFHSTSLGLQCSFNF